MVSTFKFKPSSEMVGVFCFPKKLQGCNSSQNNDWTNRSGLYVTGSGRVSWSKKNKIVFGGMKFSYYIYINKHRHYG